jgi:hypothetical protein
MFDRDKGLVFENYTPLKKPLMVTRGCYFKIDHNQKQETREPSSETPSSSSSWTLLTSMQELSRNPK